MSIKPKTKKSLSIRPMFTAMGSRIWSFQNLWGSVLLLLITIFLHHLTAAAAADVVDADSNGTKTAVPPSFGDIYAVTYPFRLDIDRPNCGFSSFVGEKNYTLYCHNYPPLLMNLNNNYSGRFLLKGIHYPTSIHLYNPRFQTFDCLPNFDLTLFMSCDREMGYDHYTYFMEITAPSKTKNNSYVILSPTCNSYDVGKYIESHIRGWYLFISSPANSNLYFQIDIPDALQHSEAEGA